MMMHANPTALGAGHHQLENKVAKLMEHTVRNVLFADSFDVAIDSVIPEGGDAIRALLTSQPRMAVRRQVVHQRAINAKQRRVLIRQYKSLRKELIDSHSLIKQAIVGGNVSPPALSTDARGCAFSKGPNRISSYPRRRTYKMAEVLQKPQKPQQQQRLAQHPEKQQQPSDHEDHRIVEYQALKTDIRNSAAVSIQKVWRGHMERRPLTTRHMKRTSVQLLWQEIKEERQRCKRFLPYANWTLDMLLQEKKHVKICLAKRHVRLAKKLGRTPQKEDKEVFRSVYEYYHAIKDRIEVLTQQLSLGAEGLRVNESLDLHSLEISLASDLFDSMDGSGGFVSPTADQARVALGNEYRRLKSEKRLLQRKLTAYEREFYKVKGRSIKFSHDIEPLRVEWEQYKQVKQKLQAPKFQEIRLQESVKS